MDTAVVRPEVVQIRCELEQIEKRMRECLEESRLC